MAAGDLFPTSGQTRARLDERILLYRVATKSARKTSRSRPNSRASNISALRLENYKHEQKLDQLEKEKKQCLQKLHGDRHIFKMSVRLPRDAGVDKYLDKYKGTFRANGEYRENEGSSRGCDWVTRQNAKTKKVHHDQGCKIPVKSKPIACKTVADLIATIKSSTPKIHKDTATTDNHSSNTPQRPVPESTTTKTTSPISDRNEKLRLLLENYEVFVPNSCLNETTTIDDAYNNSKISGLPIEQKWHGNSEDSCTLDTEAACFGTSTSSFSRSRSAQTTNERIAIPTGSKSETKVPLHGQNGVMKTTQQESFCPAVRQLVAMPNCVTSGIAMQKDVNRETYKRNESCWNAASKGFPKKKDSEVKVDMVSNAETYADAYGKLEYGAKLYRISSPEFEVIQNEPVSRTNSCKHRVSFASMSDMESSVIRENLTQYYNIKPQDHNVKLFQPYHTIPCEEMNKSCSPKKFKTSDFDCKDEGEEIQNLHTTLELNSGHSSQDVCTRPEKRGSRRETQELPLKLFDPQFPMDYRKLFHLLYKRKSSNNRVIDRNTHSTSYFKHLSASREHGRKQNDMRESDEEVVKVRMKRTAMMVLGKGFEKEEDPVKAQKAKETRQKMDQFFARLQSSINPIEELTTRPNSPLHRLTPTDITTKKNSDHKEYKRAAPWPVEIWC